MALSEREQKVLDQLEELMSNEDPHFASSVSSASSSRQVACTSQPPARRPR